ncbi:MAG: HEAT repeat domain-containing protein [Gemmatimonadota bacterium]|nr:HEAT repeat domain-containing protein [Gemmatimonadota bacterium]
MPRSQERDAASAVPINAAWALGQIADAAAIPALTQALRADSDPLVRKAAAWTLGQVVES